MDTKLVDDLRDQGLSMAQIAERMEVPIGTIKSYLARRNPDKTPQGAGSTKLCLSCGKALTNPTQKFCSEPCRKHWWYIQRRNVQSGSKKAYTCAYCGQAIYDYVPRKYCSTACQFAARKKGV